MTSERIHRPQEPRHPEPEERLARPPARGQEQHEDLDELRRQVGEQQRQIWEEVSQRIEQILSADPYDFVISFRQHDGQ